MLLRLGSPGIRGIVENPWIIIVILIIFFGFQIYKRWAKKNGKWDGD